MTGRESFKKYRKLISLLAAVFSLFGRKGNASLLRFCRHTTGRMGLVLRYIFLRNCAAKIGENVSVHPGVYLLNVHRLALGDNVSIHPMCYIDAVGEVVVGNNVSVAHSSSVLSSNHQWTDGTRAIKYNEIKMGAVHIADDVWIGCGVRILAGVTIETRAIVAAGSVVTGNVSSNTIVGGVPAKVLKSI